MNIHIFVFIVLGGSLLKCIFIEVHVCLSPLLRLDEAARVSVKVWARFGIKLTLYIALSHESSKSISRLPIAISRQSKHYAWHFCFK